MRLFPRHGFPILPLITAPILTGALVIAAVGQMPERAIEVESYWQQPLAAQGYPPNNWSELERSFSPQDCGQCHLDQFAQWQTSLHARSFSPGLAGQALAYTPADTARCLQCHAPLAEQHTALEAARNLGAAGLTGNFAAAGDVCAGCHVRQYRHFGPPQRGTGATGASALPAPHGGVFRTKLFESAEFCSGCHQFPASTAVNGKPLLNTLAEWRASPQAARGMVCQTCHMPQRRHLWRGIHDPAMVASGLTPHLTANAAGVRFEIANTGVGHAFPTYPTPKVVLHAVALDAAGAPRAETLRSREIARSVRWADDHWIELSDTRLFPGQSAAIELEWRGSDDVFDRARKKVESADDAADWFFAIAPTDVFKSPGAGGPPIAKVGTIAMPMLGLYPAAQEGQPAPQPTYIELLLPAGRSGWIAAGAVRLLFTDHLCYARTPSGEWKIATVDQPSQ